ncbi:hypothetical protein [Flavobacterium cellulosilyticum]|uniref:Uncharacterized protein n=1 Tax=Flavobacterium cellulosilyticum TaxID=2541731 RepID=A0A4V2YZL5_9FLAO|nr:hypothetical protein [Flavobacterium cellulosilyticum]TDD97067.1 hypothetical protein E0F76_10545 [Flavobacterium cellulosilyticum]
MRRESIFLILLILLFTFGLGNLFKYQILTIEILTKNKEFVSVLKDIITLIAIIVGAILSYFRFFIGRTFSAKAEIEFEVSLIETPNNLIMHTVTVTIVNKGNLTIWEPLAKIGIKEFNTTKDKREQVIEKFLEKSYFGDEGKRDMVVDAGEKAYFMIWREFDNTTWAVTYSAEITSSNGRKWQKTITIANKIKAS